MRIGAPTVFNVKPGGTNSNTELLRLICILLIFATDLGGRGSGGAWRSVIRTVFCQHATSIRLSVCKQA
jgi:hypothetical protein